MVNTHGCAIVSFTVSKTAVGIALLRENLYYHDAKFITNFEVRVPCEMSVHTLFFKSWSFRGYRIQWNFLGQTVASRCEGFRRFRDWLRPHLQGVDGGLVEPKLMTRCHKLSCVYLRSARAARDGMRPLWLVAGVEGSFFFLFVVALPCLLKRRKLIVTEISWCFHTEPEFCSLRRFDWNLQMYEGRTESHEQQFFVK